MRLVKVTPAQSPENRKILGAFSLPCRKLSEDAQAAIVDGFNRDLAAGSMLGRKMCQLWPYSNQSYRRIPAHRNPDCF